MSWKQYFHALISIFENKYLILDIYIYIYISRSSRPKVFYKKVVFRILKNSKESTCARVSFLIKIQGSRFNLNFLWTGKSSFSKLTCFDSITNLVSVSQCSKYTSVLTLLKTTPLLHFFFKLSKICQNKPSKHVFLPNQQ